MFKENLNKVLVKDVMISPVITIRDTDDFHVVRDKFAAHDIRHLPVVEEHGVLVGLITQRTLYKIHSPRKLEDGSWYYDKDLLDGFILKNVMIKDPFTLKAENTLLEAIEAVCQFKLGSIPVVDDLRRPVGILTRGDILTFFLIK